MNKRIVTLSVLGSLLLTSLCYAQDSPTRAITQITGDLYRFQNNAHYSVFLVTHEGIIATDPINEDAATWLKAELKKRFDKPVKYLLYSHDHGDHIGGGKVFADEAIVVAHELTKAKIISEKRPTAVPEVTFADRMTIELGRKKVELIYPGKCHSDNSIVMYFPEERTVFAVDFVSVKRLPYRDLSDSYVPDWMDALMRVETIDFEILAPGHGQVGTKADVVEHRQYLQDLYTGVLTAAREGKTLDEIKKTIKMDKYKGFGQYDSWLELNIEGMYRMISAEREAK